MAAAPPIGTPTQVRWAMDALSLLTSVASFTDGALKDALGRDRGPGRGLETRLALNCSSVTQNAGEAQLSSTLEQLASLANATQGSRSRAGRRSRRNCISCVPWHCSLDGQGLQRRGREARGHGRGSPRAVQLFAAIPEESLAPRDPLRTTGWPWRSWATPAEAQEAP